MPKIMLATPLHGSSLPLDYVHSLTDTLSAKADTPNGKLVAGYLIQPSSCLHWCRNFLVDVFLANHPDPDDRLLFVDSDQCWRPDDVRMLLAHDRDVVSAMVAQKLIDWQRVADMARQNPAMPGVHLAHLASPRIDAADFMSKQSSDGLVEVGDIGAGFLMVKRRVFDACAPYVPLASYAGQPPHRVFFKWTETNDGYQSEDWNFSALVRSCGFQIFADPRAQVGHIGSFVHRTPAALLAPKGAG